jgi:predicted transcriptional regulator
MDIQAEKISLAQLLLQTEDVTIIKKVKAIFNSQRKDWWDELSIAQKEAIEEGLDDFKNGRTISYEDVKKQLGLL